MPPSTSIPPLAQAYWNRCDDAVLTYELNQRGLRTARQQPIPVVYENVRIDTGFRADLIVEDKVIVEIKSVEVLAPVHKKQLLTYLRLADKRLGLLINFHVALIKDGITRIANGLEDETHAKPQRRVGSQLATSRRFEVEDLASFKTRQKHGSNWMSSR